MGVCISQPPALCLAPAPDFGPQTWPPVVCTDPGTNLCLLTLAPNLY